MLLIANPVPSSQFWTGLAEMLRSFHGQAFPDSVHLKLHSVLLKTYMHNWQAYMAFYEKQLLETVTAPP